MIKAILFSSKARETVYVFQLANGIQRSGAGLKVHYFIADEVIAGASIATPVRKWEGGLKPGAGSCALPYFLWPLVLNGCETMNGCEIYSFPVVVANSKHRLTFKKASSSNDSSRSDKPEPGRVHGILNLWNGMQECAKISLPQFIRASPIHE